jgi:tetratricopeptide (TPR) repeat protein
MITAITTLLGLGVLGFVAYFARMNKQARKFVDESADAMAAIARGDLPKAKQIFERWLDAKSPQVQSAAQHGLVIVLMRQSQLEQALDVLTKARDRESLTPPSAVTATDFASCYALAGDLESAQSWLGKAAEREAHTRAMFPALTAFPRAVLACRQGRSADAARMLDEHWSDFEAMLNGQSVRILRVVRAFAHAKASARDAADALANAKPAYPGEYAFLGVSWPEMAAFLASHELT